MSCGTGEGLLTGNTYRTCNTAGGSQAPAVALPPQRRPPSFRSSGNRTEKKLNEEAAKHEEKQKWEPGGLTLLLEGGLKPWGQLWPGAVARDICAGEMAWWSQATWLTPALLLLWVPGEGLQWGGRRVAGRGRVRGQELQERGQETQDGTPSVHRIRHGGVGPRVCLPFCNHLALDEPQWGKDVGPEEGLCRRFGDELLHTRVSGRVTTKRTQGRVYCQEAPCGSRVPGGRGSLGTGQGQALVSGSWR